MKRAIYYLFAAIALIAAASCQTQKESEPKCGGHIVTLFFDNSEATNTSLHGMTPQWEVGDQIWLSNGTEEETIILQAEDIVDGVANVSVAISGTLYAVYPAGVQYGLNTELNNVGINIPYETDGSFAKAHIAVAKGTTSLCFRSAVSILEIPMKMPSIDKIEITAASISGGYSVDNIGPSQSAHGITTNSKIFVSEMASKGPYYIAVGPTTLAAGAKFEFKHGDNIVNTRTTTSAQTLAVGKIYDIGPALIADVVPGLFSVSSGHKVGFAKGNLWCDYSTGTWSFEEKQYVSYPDPLPTTTYSFNEKHAARFQWVSEKEYACGTYYNVVGNLTDFLFTNSQTDVKKPNPDLTINGNKGMWRNLTGGTAGEWDYVFNKRTTAAGTASTVNGIPDARWMKCIVGGVAGVILFPDKFVWPSSPGAPDESTATRLNTVDYDFEIPYTISEFDKLEAAGCVFLPAVGCRVGTVIEDANTNVEYWTATPHVSFNNSGQALDVENGKLSMEYKEERYLGLAIRLVVDL